MHSLEAFQEGVTWNVQKLNAAPFAMLASMHGACVHHAPEQFIWRLHQCICLAKELTFFTNVSYI